MGKIEKYIIYAALAALIRMIRINNALIGSNTKLIGANVRLIGVNAGFFKATD